MSERELASLLDACFMDWIADQASCDACGVPCVECTSSPSVPLLMSARMIRRAPCAMRAVRVGWISDQASCDGCVESECRVSSSPGADESAR